LTTTADAVDDAIARVFRHDAAALTASITRVLGDFAVAEEIVGDTLIVALERWRRDGVPPNPAAWLMTTARRRALDALRRDRTYRRKLSELAADGIGWDGPASDDRLRLIYTCCHPALGPEARVALTLQAVLGFTTADIAAAFIVSESAVAQRLSRARRKIAAARIPYAVPVDDELADRLASVLDVLYLAFNEGYLSSRPTAAFRRDLAEDAAWLAAILAEALPGEPEVLGLLALMRLQLARSAARFDDAGHLVLLRDQDRSRWDRPRIEAAIGDLERAAALKRPGRFQLQAAIAACHADAASWGETDWVQVLVLYDLLLAMLPTPVVRLNRAIALREVAGAEAALAEVDAVAGELDRYHLLHATRAQLLLEIGAPAAAREAEARALSLARNPAERWILAERLGDDSGRVRSRSTLAR
jgi:RNA polymerase sigma factor (sigma-70 family)